MKLISEVVTIDQVIAEYAIKLSSPDGEQVILRDYYIDLVKGKVILNLMLVPMPAPALTEKAKDK